MDVQRLLFEGALAGGAVPIIGIVLMYVFAAGLAAVLVKLIKSVEPKDRVENKITTESAQNS